MAVTRIAAARLRSGLFCSHPATTFGPSAMIVSSGSDPRHRSVTEEPALVMTRLRQTPVRLTIATRCRTARALPTRRSAQVRSVGLQVQPRISSAASCHEARSSSHAPRTNSALSAAASRARSAWRPEAASTSQIIRRASRSAGVPLTATFRICSSSRYTFSASSVLRIRRASRASRTSAPVRTAGSDAVASAA